MNHDSDAPACSLPTADAKRPWLKRPCLWLGFLLFAAALGIRVAYVLEYSSQIQIDYYTFDQTDNHTFHQWALNIAKGDWLCRDQIHPYHKWTADVAPEEQWHQWYRKKEIFHQAPLYPYLVASLYALFGADVLFVKLFQALMGAATALMVFLIARIYFGRWTGFVAGGLVALSGFHLYYDAFILREGLITFLLVTFLYLSVRAFETGKKGTLLLSGLVLGLCMAAKPNAMILVVVYLPALFFIYRKERFLRRCLRMLVFLAGVVIPMVPICARNAALDCPVLKTSTRGPTAFINGNLRGQTGTDWSPPPEETREILFESDYELGRVIATTLKSYIENPADYMATIWNKTRAFFNSFEVPNNTNYYLIKKVSRTLDVAIVSFWFLSAAALTGMILLIPAAQRIWQIYTVTILLSLATIAFFIVARFRQPLVPLLAIFAAYSLVWFLKRLRSRRWIGAGAAAALFCIMLAWTHHDRDTYENMASAYSGVMKKLIAQQDFAGAEIYRERLFAEYRELSGGHYRPDIRNALQKLEEAFTFFLLGSFYEQDHAQRHLHHARGYFLTMESTQRMEFEEYAEYTQAAVMRALELDPEIRGARKIMGMCLAEQVRRDAEMPYNEKQQKLAQAAGLFETEIVRHPDELDCVQYLASIYIVQGKYIEALPMYLRYLKRAKTWDFDVEYQIALILTAQPSPTPALAARTLAMARELYQWDPRDNRFARLYADALERAGDLQAARAVFEKLIEQDPEGAAGYEARIQGLNEK